MDLHRAYTSPTAPVAWQPPDPGRPLVGVGSQAPAQERIPVDHPALFGVVELVLAPLFVLGSLEFVGPFEVRGWKLAGTLVPFAYIGWSVWLLALGIGLLRTA